MSSGNRQEACRDDPWGKAAETSDNTDSVSSYSVSSLAGILKAAMESAAALKQRPSPRGNAQISQPPNSTDPGTTSATPRAKVSTTGAAAPKVAPAYFSM